MNWRYVLDKYVDKKDAKCPILDIYVGRKWELEGDEPYKEQYIKNLECCKKLRDNNFSGFRTKDEWLSAWQNQYWHLFVSWFAIWHNSDFKKTVPHHQCVELWLWLYEAQGIFTGYEEKMREFIKNTSKIPSSLEEKDNFIRELLRAGGLVDKGDKDWKPSWSDLKYRARWK